MRRPESNSRGGAFKINPVSSFKVKLDNLFKMELKKRKNRRSSINSTGSAGTGSSGGTLVAAGEMY
ncbi:MAG: hypothetical protein JXR78_13560 [Victivallales bacterium]|nr:hypothetical protein [Victivallales bacterium]